jgi:hypothetical protein
VSMTCGIDWSERHHDVAVVDDDAQVVTRARIGDDAAGFSRLLELLAEHGDGDPGSVDVAIESDKGLFVAALVAAGFTVFAINPRAVARYRERYGQAGGKSDPGDAVYWRTSCAPIGMCIGRCLLTLRRPAPSRWLLVSIRRRSGPGNRR